MSDLLAVRSYPYLVPPDLTISRAAAPEASLRLVLGARGVGGVLLLPSLLYLFRVFKASPADPSARLPQESPP